MDKHYTYLLINLCTVILPLALSFDKRVQFYKSWKYLWPGMLITGIFFLAWDVFFTQKAVWAFNPSEITDIYFFHLPLEEILFFLTVPFACVFIYACLNYYTKWQLPQLVVKVITTLLYIVSAVLLFVYTDRLYTLVTFGLLLVLIGLGQYLLKPNWLSRFYVAYLVALVPFFIVNGLLTSIPVVIYAPGEMMNVLIGSIPLEDFFYLMALLLMNIGFFEYFKPSAQTKKR